MWFPLKPEYLSRILYQFSVNLPSVFLCKLLDVKVFSSSDLSSNPLLQTEFDKSQTLP